jgi:hypothetical protein
MPSLMRFLIVAGLLTTVTLGGLYLLQAYYEPELREETKSVPALKIKKE